MQKLAVVMVGLPARGKTYVARRLSRYLSWLGYPSRVFNVGDYRRKHLGAHMNHEFFSPDNAEGNVSRLAMAKRALDDMLDWLRGDGQVALYDATNTTRARRDMVIRRCADQGVDVVFIETICDDPAVIDANVRETKVNSPDYVGTNPDDAVRDFRARIAHYAREYEPIVHDDLSYVKYIDMGRQLVVNRMRGLIPSKIVTFLFNLAPIPHEVVFTRHGESVFNERGLLGGDPALSPRGLGYGARLAAFVEREKLGGASVWTSSLRRTMETAKCLGVDSVSWRELDEISAGICEGMSYADIKERMPSEFEARAKDKFRYRYPRGESYEDVIRRLDTIVVALERERKPVLIIGHQAVLRALYAYLTGRSLADCPYLDIPLHTVIRVRPRIYETVEERVPLDK